MTNRWARGEVRQCCSPDQPVKRCLHCRRNLSTAAFGRSCSALDGLRPECNECRKLRLVELADGAARVRRGELEACR